MVSNVKLAAQAALRDESTFHGSKHKCGETLRYVSGHQPCVRCAKINSRKWSNDNKERAALNNLRWSRDNKTNRKLYHALRD